MMQSTTVENSYQKNAWMILVLLSVIGVIYALLIFAGVNFDTQLQNQLGQSPSSFSAANPKAWSALQYAYNGSGINLLALSIFGFALASTSFRGGHKFAWYAVLFLPVYFLYYTIADYNAGGSNWPLFAVFIFLSLAALILPYRKFFPKK